MSSGKALSHVKGARTGEAKAPAAPKRHTVTLIPGDGIGEEVAEAVVRIVEASGASVGWDRHLSGQAAQARFGSPLPEALLQSIRTHKVALKGRIDTPVGGPGHGATTQESPNVALRRELDLFAAVRPARNLPGLPGRHDGVDLVVIRENTEDVYVGIEHEVVPGVVQSIKVTTQAACLRISRFAFEYARLHGRRRVTCLHKANILKMSDGLFLECARRTAAEHPGIDYSEMIADNAIMQLVLDPSRFDVLLMENLIGDIVSDLCAGLAGGLGTVPGINLGEGLAVFEAIHGHAPHLEGRDLASPLPLLAAAVAMLGHLGETEAAGRIERAIGATLTRRQALTPDLGGAAHTSEMAQAIMSAMAASS